MTGSLFGNFGEGLDIAWRVGGAMEEVLDIRDSIRFIAVWEWDLSFLACQTAAALSLPHIGRRMREVRFVPLHQAQGNSAPTGRRPLSAALSGLGYFVDA